MSAVIESEHSVLFFNTGGITLTEINKSIHLTKLTAFSLIPYSERIKLIFYVICGSSKTVIALDFDERSISWELADVHFINGLVKLSLVRPGYMYQALHASS